MTQTQASLLLVYEQLKWRMMRARTMLLNMDALNSTLLLAARREAFALAALTGRDPRGLEKALLHGLDRIKSLEARELLRPHVESWRASHGLVAK